MHFNGWPRQQLEAAPLDAARRTDPRRPDRSWLTARATHLRPFRTTRVHGNVGHRRLGPPMVLATQEANRDFAPMSVMTCATYRPGHEFARTRLRRAQHRRARAGRR